ncbi:MAG TPA: hypothetical protein VND92_01655 [Vicinamibacterales bacterium]|nr:hypothetical protein [Vicinamibacterales bacterium]
MRTHSSLVLLSGALVLGGLLAAPVPARAQSGDQSSSSTSTNIGGFDTQGSISIGYRVTDVTGYQQKYRELYNLSDGLRLPDFNLFGRAAQGKDLFADSFSLSASGLGGDPYQAIQFMARKNQLYDLRASFRQSNFYWDQNNGVYENGLSAVTNSHAWNTERTLGNVSFLLHATNNLRLAFDFSHSGRDGMNLTTRTVDYFGSPSSWGAFARANAYSMLAPLNETTNRYTGGFDYTWQDWNVHYRAGYQIFDDAVTADAASPISIDLTDPLSPKETLENGTYQDYRRLTTPVSEFSYDGKITPKFEWRGGYTFYRYSGPAGLQAAYSGLTRSGTKVVPYDLSLDTRTNVTEPTHVLDQGFTWDATDWVSVLVDYRYQWIGIDSTGNFASDFNSTFQTGTSTDSWRQNKNQLDFDLEFMPRADLLVRAGVRYLRNNIRVVDNGTVDTYATQSINTWWPTLSLSWKPNAIVNLHADVDSIQNDVSFTRLTPETNVGSRVVLNVHPNDQWSIVDAMNVRHQTLDAANYTANIRSNAITANYQFNDNLALFGGYSYDSFDATAGAGFLRGTAPLTVTLLDNTTNHVWQAGVSAKPMPRLGVKLAGNYIRTTGQGSITGETPLYGPVTYPYASGTVYYEIPTIGRLSVDVTRTYYIEELVPLNNFGARIVMVRWTRSF